MQYMFFYLKKNDVSIRKNFRKKFHNAKKNHREILQKRLANSNY
jgi:hypothetical protein